MGTHTYAILEISPAAFDEIKAKLAEAGYGHAFHDDVIDMHGIAVQAASPADGPGSPDDPAGLRQSIERLGQVASEVMIVGGKEIPRRCRKCGGTGVVHAETAKTVSVLRCDACGGTKP